jgi:hypothetical protein
LGGEGTLSELRSAIGQFQSEVLSQLPDAVIEEDFAELHRMGELVESERLRRLAELERRGVHERDGHVSVVAWLAARFKVAWGLARESVRVARALEDMPVARRALEDGDIPLSAVGQLAAAREVDPESFSRSEPMLVEAAAMHSVRDLQRVLGHWRVLAESRSGKDPEERAYARRRLHVSKTFLGMVRGDFELECEGGDTVLTAIGCVVDGEARSGSEDDRTPAQRRADALVEICRQFLGRSDRPAVGGERAHVTVTVPVEVLAGASDEPAELDHVGHVSASVARRLACDASLMRVVMSGRSEPLDVGRRTPVVPPALRRAVIARDRHCRFGACDRQASWCDAHHVVPWSEGGPTSLDNLTLLCRRHHRAVHPPGRFRLVMVDGRPTVFRPDGTVVEGRAPP